VIKLICAISGDEVGVPTLTVRGSNNVVYGTFPAGTTLTATVLTWHLKMWPLFPVQWLSAWPPHCLHGENHNLQPVS